MDQTPDKPDQPSHDGEVVYRRSNFDEGAAVLAEPVSPATKRVTPALMPVLIGFGLLLALVLILGQLSVQKIDDVSARVRDLQQQHAARLELALKLRVALTRLNNEARARARVEGEGTPEGIRPPFAAPLNAARQSVRDLLPDLDNPGVSGIEEWNALRRDLPSYVKTTEDSDTYSQLGFVQFRTIDSEVNQLLEEIRSEQEGIQRESDRAEAAAISRIRLLTIIALLTGVAVAAGTLYEVQRRFRQVRESMLVAEHERAFSSQMLEGMVTGVAAIDAHDCIRSANAVFFEIFPGARPGMSLHDDFAPPGARRMLEAAAASRVEKATYRGRWDHNAGEAEARERTFDVYSSPLTIDNDHGQIITLVNVTEAVEAERAARRAASLAAMGQASAQVAHEIKNPLGSIRLGVSMLREMAPGADAQNTIDLVERGIEHLNNLVVDVTQFSRQRPLDRNPEDLKHLLDESLELVAEKLTEKQTPVEKHYSDEPLEGEWDSDQLRQVFVNLLANAAEASQEGSPITIDARRVTGGKALEAPGNGKRAGNGDRWVARISIADRGRGMDEKTRERIFEPFFTTKKRGTGLGLAIAKQIVEQHGGTLNVESSPGEGTRFTIELPFTANG